ncbi:MAG: CotH kinase family protein [Saprospiraceae bacterium]
MQIRLKSILFFLLLSVTYAQSQCCTYTLIMQDSYGDGWNGANLEVFINNVSIGNHNAQNFASTDTFTVCDDDSISFLYTEGMYENENSYKLYDPAWSLIFADGPNPQIGNISVSTGNCSGISVPGNNPCTAIAIDTGLCITQDNTGFVGSGIDPKCADFKGGDVWFKMQVPPSGNLGFETINGSLSDTGIAVWTDSTCTDLRMIGCDDDGGNGSYSFLIVYDLKPAQTIYIQVWGYGGATGTFELCASDLGTVKLDSSELPIVLINTLGQTIVDDPKINCLMQIKYNGTGKITYVTDTANVYNGNIGIEIRGASSSGYPQRPYGIETIDTLGDNNDVSLLGMPAENDWVLISNFNDLSLMRNPLAYHLFGAMGNYTTHTSLCEVLIDSSYKGIYMFGEKIKRDKNRVNIAKLTEVDTTGDKLTGGYILQQNYWDQTIGFQSNFSPIDHPEIEVHFLYQDPKPEDLVPVQKEYIASYVDSLETALYSTNFADTINGYRKYLDVKSFIDYFLVNELSRNFDGFKKSVYYNKDKNSKGGKLKAGPVWDFDWAWKNVGSCTSQNLEGSGWAHLVNDCFNDTYSSGWYIRLLQDTTFANQLRCTYENYRQTIFDTTYIFAYIDSIGTLVQNAQARHFKKWPILGRSGPAPEIGEIATTYAGVLDSLKNWINLRLVWLDENLPGLCKTVISGTSQESLSDMISCFPNPAQDFVQVEYTLLNPAKVSVTMHNYLGDLVQSTQEQLQGAGSHTLKLETANIPSGIYLLQFKAGSIIKYKKLVIVK